MCVTGTRELKMLNITVPGTLKYGEHFGNATTGDGIILK